MTPLEWMRTKAADVESVTVVLDTAELVVLSYRANGMNYTAELSNGYDLAAYRAAVG